jgi:hypothetical protein
MWECGVRICNTVQTGNCSVDPLGRHAHIAEWIRYNALHTVIDGYSGGVDPMGRRYRCPVAMWCKLSTFVHAKRLHQHIHHIRRLPQTFLTGGAFDDGVGETIGLQFALPDVE